MTLNSRNKDVKRLFTTWRATAGRPYREEFMSYERERDGSAFYNESQLEKTRRRERVVGDE
jgi:hypothetical protein